MNNFYSPYGGQYPPQWGFDARQYELRKQKNRDKKILGIAGRHTALAVVLYSVFSVAFWMLLSGIREIAPRAEILFDGPAGYAIDIINSILCVGMAFFIAYSGMKKKKIVGVLPLGTTYNRKASVFLTMFMLGIVIFSTMAVNFVSIFVQSALGVSFTSGLENIEINGFGETSMAVIAMAVVPAIVEEISIRGIVLQPLRRYGDGFAIVTSALVFSLMHGNMVQIPYTFLAGLYFGYVAVATGSIWPSIVLHFLNNLYSVIVTAVDSATDYGNAAALIGMAVVLIIGIIGGIGYFSSGYRPHLAKGVKSLTTGEKLKAFFVNPLMAIAAAMILFSIFTSVSGS